MLSIIGISAVVLGGLIVWLWPSKLSEENPMTTILATGDPGQIAFIKSLFDETEIPYVVKGEGVQDLFGIGRLGTGYNTITGPVQIQVPKDRVEEAEALLKDLEGELGHS